MTEVRSQRSAVRNQKVAINCRDAKCAESFSCGFCASASKLISDLRLLISGLCAMLFALCSITKVRVMQILLVAMILIVSGLFPDSSRAAWRNGPVRIGVLTPSWGPPPQVVGLRDGLQELGYSEGEQFIIGVRFTQGDITALPAVARELVKLGSDLIFAHRDSAAKAVQMATTRIPSVFVGVNDPVGIGLIKSFARPGGNITGVTDLELALAPKRLELFHEVVPGLKRVLFPYDPADTYSVAGVTVLGVNVREGTRPIQRYARELGLTFPLVLDLKGVIQASYGVIGLPTTFLIGRDGRSVGLAVGPREWDSGPARAIIQALLGESAGSKGSP